jgi:hypothetical protein
LRAAHGDLDNFLLGFAEHDAASDSTVRSINSSRACTSTWSQTSAGTRFSSMSRRLNANSVFDADGKPTSISLKPHFTSVWNSSSFWPTFMGTASA